MPAGKVMRRRLDQLDLSLGKRTRLHRLLYEHGPANGTLLFLPIDQGLEHGPIDFFPNPPSADPEFQLRLAREGGYSGIVFQVGIASKYMRDYVGTVPLILKLNGKTAIPPDDEALSPLTASVEDAVRLGADAIGYTLYVGSPRQADDFVQFEQVREEAERYGMPIIVWSYPRGSAVEQKGGRDGLFAIDYAARVANELGADVVKLNLPKCPSDRSGMPEEYRDIEWDPDNNEAVTQIAARVVSSAGRTLVLFSGGSKLGDDDLLAKAHACMAAGATGLIFGRNMWQRPWEEALAMTRKIKDEVMSEYSA
jgi:class I fructose-bisphosphate aldolase